jgi:hypothetical protein
MSFVAMVGLIEGLPDAIVRMVSEMSVTAIS